MEELPPRGRAIRVLTALGLHRHRPDPDLSAVVSFASCRCGVMIWPASSATPEPSPAADTPTAVRGRSGWY